MDNLKQFLEVSSIHGVSYISSSRGLIRVFWIWIVISSFVGASLLIRLSFKGWSDSPIKTTIETLPINKIILPKVTVCPPQNTFTNLNYDIMINDKYLDNKTLNELLGFEEELLHGYYYNTLMDNMDIMIEENRYFNWYRGISSMKLPYQDALIPELTRYEITTYDIEGKVSTKDFGKSFNLNNLKQFIDMDFNIYLDIKKNYTIMLEMKREPLDTESDENSYENFDFNNIVNLESTIKNGSLKLPSAKIRTANIHLSRKISDTLVRTGINMKMMPGFELSWKSYYKGDPPAYYKKLTYIKSFRRFIITRFVFSTDFSS